jgi:hypothetical protein
MKKILIGISIAILSLLIYNLSDNHFLTTDPLSNNFTAINIIYNHRLDITNLKEKLTEKGLIGVSVPNNQGVLFSRTPILDGIFSVPFFYVADKFYGINKFHSELLFENGEYYQIIGKKYAAFVTSISVFLVYICLLNIFKKYKTSIIGTLIYAFGTFAYSTAAQANWEHAPSLFLISLSYYFLIKFLEKRKKKLIFLTTSILMIAYFIRPINIIFLISLLLLLIYLKNKKSILTFIITAIILYLAYIMFCSSVGIPDGYQTVIIDSLKNINVINAVQVLITILISPNSGLLIFHSIFLFSLIGIIIYIEKSIKNSYFLKKSNLQLILLYSLVSITCILGLNSIWLFWTGGFSWGPRLLTEATIPLIIFLIYFLTNVSKTVLYFFIPLLIVTSISSIFFSAMSIYCNTAEWNDKYWSHTTMLQGAWENNPSEIYYYMFTKRSFYTNKLYLENGQILFKTQTHLIQFKEKNILKIYERIDNFTPQSN